MPRPISRAEEAHKDDHVVEGEHARQDVDPEAVIEPELYHQDKVRYKPAVEKHRYHCDLHVDLFSDKPRPAHRVGHHGGEQHVRYRGRHRAQDGYFETREYVLVLEHDLVCVKAEVRRPPGRSPSVRDLGRGE